MGEEGLLPLGRIVRAHGLRGEVKVLAYILDQEDLLRLERFFIRQKGTLKEFRVEGGRYAPGRRGLLFKFEGIDDREAAEALIGLDLLVPIEELPPLEEGQYYYYQLLGLEVLLEDGQKLGHIKTIWPIGPYDLYLVKTPEGKEYLIPAVEEVILEIDLQRKQIRIRPLPGLLEAQE